MTPPVRLGGARCVRIHFPDLSVEKSGRACIPLGRRGYPRRPGWRAPITQRR
jgi:hypothetical protein